MRNISDLHPRLQDKVYELIDLCAKHGISIGISECLRTVAEQDALYAQGRTKPGSIVTNARGSSYSSMHQWGIAFDFYLKVDVDKDGSTSDDAFNNSTGLFNQVGSLGKSIGLEWGGNWTSIKDLPHFQLPDWGSTASKLKAQYGTPDKFMASWKKGGSVVTESASKTTTTVTNTLSSDKNLGVATVTANSGVVLRASASTAASKLASIPYKTAINVEKLDAGNADGYTWAKVIYAGKTGYVAQKYLNVSKKPSSESTTTKSATSSKVEKDSSYTKSTVDAAKEMTKSYAGTYTTTSNLNLRTGASTGKSIITVIPKGSSVSNYGYHTGDWLLVAYGKYTGYVSKSYLKKK